MLAGAGVLPEVIASAVKASGRPLVCIEAGAGSPALVALADVHRCVAAGAWAEGLAVLRQHNVRELVVAGQFPRARLFAGSDAVASALVGGAPDRRDASIFERSAAFLAALGISVVEQTRFVADLLAPPGVLTARPPTSEEAADITMGRVIARRLADLDVGQTVVIARRTVLAVEAAEGTDAAIRRGGAMLPGAVVVKVSRPRQDPRFDIPTVGPETIATMREVGCVALGIDGRRTLLLQRERMIAAADAAGIAIIAEELPPLGVPLDAAV